MRRYWYCLLGCFFLGICIWRLLFPVQKKPHWECVAEPFHALLEPYPTYSIQCNGAFSDDTPPDRPTYQVELRLVAVVYGRGASAIPPFSGYLTDYSEFMTAAQGDVRSSLYMFPIQTLLDGKPTTWNFGSFIVRVEKSHDHFRLVNTEPSGTTYVQEFELPEGETFVTNLGEHPLRANSAYEVVLPGFLSQFQSYMPVDPTPWQMEQFLLVRYGTVDESER